MRLLLCITVLLATQSLSAQWIKQNVDTTASLRGLAVVSEKVVWASGTGGTVIRTIDGGKTWKVMTVPGAEKLDFRDVEAFDANTAYILSIGNGELSRIYKTTDGGTTWKEQFRNKNEKAFFDAVACWDAKNCIAMSDPVNGRFLLYSTFDGEKWAETPLPPGSERSSFELGKAKQKPSRFRFLGVPLASEGEAAFAASGTCLIAQGHHSAFLASGGNDARIFVSWDQGMSWSVTYTPMLRGSAGSGIFSISMFDSKRGVIVGGNYEKPDESRYSLALTEDGGETWELGTGLTGYRSGVKYIDRKTIIAVGTNGSDITRDGGKTWKVLGKENLNAVQSKGRKATWAVGPNGMVVKLK